MKAISDPRHLPDMYRWLDSVDVLAVDTETNGLDAYGKAKHRICGVSLYSGDFGCYLTFRHGAGRNLEERHLQDLTAYLNKRLKDLSITLLMWNAKFDLHMLHADGLDLPITGIEDVMLAAHLMNENESTFALKPLSDKYLSDTSSLDEQNLQGDVEAVVGHSMGSKAWKGEMWRLHADVVADYAITDVRLTWEMDALYKQALTDWDLLDLYQELCDYECLLTRMEAHGIKLDKAAIYEHMATSGPDFEKTQNLLVERAIPAILDKPLEPKKLEGKKTINSLWKLQQDPTSFNPGSPKQLGYVFDWEGTDKQFLESIPADHPDFEIVQAILDYRVLSKMNGTYYDAYLDLIDEYDVLRPNYNMIGTVNGRLSCNRPNIQNVPRYSSKRRVKDVFIPSNSEYVLLETDYRAAELRLACHFAEERKMAAIINEGRDPHGETATAMGVPRHVGKTLNFAVIYGAGVRGLTKLLKCDEQTARDYLYGYFDLYPGFKRLAAGAEAYAIQYGFIRMPTGRYRHFNTWQSETRKAMNSLIQGAASEMLRVGMQRVDDRIRADGLDAHLLFQVHDSIMCEVHKEQVPDLLKVLRQELTNFDYNPAPDIECKTGTRWGQLEEIAV